MTFAMLRCNYCESGFEKQNTGPKSLYCVPCRKLIRQAQNHETYLRHKNKVIRRRDRWRKSNSDMNRQQAKSRYWKNPEARRASALRAYYKDPEKSKIKLRAQHLKRFGLTINEYERLLVLQNGVCAICKQQCRTGRRLAVDHEHGTGIVRGLLCGNCNQGLGKFLDSPESLEIAARYLRQDGISWRLKAVS